MNSLMSLRSDFSINRRLIRSTSRRIPIPSPQSYEELMSSTEEDEEILFLRETAGGPLSVLYLDGLRSHIRSISRLRSINLSKLEDLSMINMHLTGLTIVPKMPKLQSLDLSDNKITGGLQKLHVCPKLSYLNLSRNKIKNIETLVPLKGLKCLQSLDLFGNDIIYIDNYRQKVFALLKTIRYLDGSIKEPDEQ